MIFVTDQNKVTFLYESGTYAVASGTSGNWIGLITSHEAEEAENVIEVRYTGAGNRNFGQLINGPKDYTGTITFYPQDFKMFYFALGSCVDVSGTSTSRHLISELNNDGRAVAYSDQLNIMPSFTIVDSKKHPTDGLSHVRQYKGCVVDTLSLKAANGEVLECELGYNAQSMLLGSKTTDIISTLNEDTSRPYIWSDCILTVGGTVMNEVNEINLSIENSNEVRHYVNGSKVAQAFVPTNRNYSLELTMDPNSNWAKKLNDFYQEGSVFNVSLAATISATENATFIMSGCKITEASLPSANEGIDEASVTIQPQTMIIAGSDTSYRYLMV